MATESEDFDIEWTEECATFRLKRPAKRNAITVAILDGLEACCDALDAGQGRALIVTGEGNRAFCAGTDLSESASLGPEASRAKGERARDLFVRLYRSSWTSVAALNGLAYGGGLELAMACTFRVAVSGIRLSLPEIKLGVLPAYGGTQFLPSIVGRARALDLMMTGRAVTAEEGLALGLVDRVVSDPGALISESDVFLRSILVHSQFALDRLRRCVDAAGTSVADEGLAVEAQAVIEAMGSEDAREGVIAFLQKREPKFKHC